MPNSPSFSSSAAHAWHPLAALAGWLLPGLGHALLGQRRRGVIIGISIIGLWLGGAFIGGLSVFDRALHPAWYLGQMLVAPTVAVDLVIQTQVKARYPHPPSPGNPSIYEPSYGKVHEQGVLYTALAGLLNLLAMLDVLYRDPRHRPADAAEPGVAPDPALPGSTTP
jgi:hypothetical protein